MGAVKKARTREMPEYAPEDFVITDTTEIDRELVEKIGIENVWIVVDKPADGYLERVSKWIEKEFAIKRADICRVDEDLKENPLEQQKNEAESSSFRSKGPVISTLSGYKRKRENYSENLAVLFVNIRKQEDKQRVVKECRNRKKPFYFLSNAYKIENIPEIEKLDIKRILPKVENFGLAKSTRSFGREHEIVFCGAPPLKPNGFLIAMEKNALVPCIVVVEEEKSKKQAVDILKRIHLLANRTTDSVEEYVDKKKWVLITTYAQILRTIRTEKFQRIRETTKSVISYDSTDKTSHLLAMHQLAKKVFTICTTQDRGKAKNIVEILPKFGIALDEIAEEIRSGK